MLSLLVYNWIKLPYCNWQNRRRFLAEWISEGRDPSRFPRFGRLTRADMRWAEEVARKVITEEAQG